ncbi:hypothetical protein UFOVP423_46 [uncultured Caudovirales phage]|uniref:Uncharacterized protein n=1 Tax=uncultured Caudovirales phage TaxID=2100421 RepID=A0A6J5M4X9_9CAUD|nr:hypothetical protein UFOVP423_46 [uncultured Caudovirales phage]
MNSLQILILIISLILALGSLLVIGLSLLLMADGYSPAKVIKALRDYLRAGRGN